MSNRKPHNSILVLAMLGTIFAFGLTVTSSTAFAQKAADKVSAAPAVKPDFEKPFELDLVVTLGKNGESKENTIRYTREEGDAGMIAIVKAGIQNINSAGYFQYIKDLGQIDIAIHLEQDATEFRCSGTIAAANEQRARTLRSAFKLLLDLASAQSKQKDAAKDLQEASAILENVSVGGEGSEIKLLLKMPKAEFWKIAGPKVVNGSEKAK